MNWKTNSFDWNHARGFLATVNEGSLSAAARELGITQPTLSRQISALERSLGVTLFERGHRSSELTSAGLELVDHVRVMFDAANQISLTASGQAQTIKGRVVLTVTNMMATFHLPPILQSLREKAPDIEIEVITSNEVRDLKKREADIAIRHGRPDQPDLIAKLLGETTASLVAAPSYLDQVGRPRTISDLQKLDFIGFVSSPRVLEPFQQMGVELTMENFKIFTESGTALYALARQGLGVTLAPDDMMSKVHDLEKLSVDIPSIPVPTWLVTHRELHTSRRIRMVYDHLSHELKAILKEVE